MILEPVEGHSSGGPNARSEVDAPSRKGPRHKFGGIATVGANVLLLVIYFASGKLGLSLAFLNASASAVWPPTGLALAALLLFGWRLWPGVFIGAFLVNITTQGSVGTTLGVATGNTLEALLGAWLASRYANGSNAFERTDSLFKFAVLSALLSPVISATFGVTSLCLGGFASWTNYWPVWVTWWLGDVASALVVAPLLLTWIGKPLPRWTRKQVIEALGLALTVVVVCKVAFLRPFPVIEGYRNSLGYLTVLPLLWAAFRFGPSGAAAAAFGTSALALYGTLHGAGPFVTPNPNMSLLFLQAYIGTVTLTALVLSTVVLERKRAEDVHARLSHIVESSNDAIISKSLDGIITSWNRGAERIFGYGPEEVIGQPIARLIPAGLQQEEAEILQRLRRGERIDDHETVRIGRDSRHLDVSVTMSPIKDSEDTIVAISTIARDITERKRAKEVLQARESELSLIYSSVSDIIFHLGAESEEHFRFLSVNPAFLEATGLSEQQVLGKLVQEVIPQSSHTLVLGKYRKAIRERKTVRWEETSQYPSGTRVGLVSVTPNFNAQGRCISLIGTVHDITDRKRAEEELRESAERFRTLADNIAQLAWMADEKGWIFWYNQRWFEYTGTTLEEMQGWGWQKVHDPQHVHRVVEKFHHHLDVGEFWEDTFPLRGKDGKFRWFLSRAYPIRDEHGKVLRWFGTNTDISERMQAEEALADAKKQLEEHARNLERIVAERTAKLRESVDELEAFSYSLSHDMRAPLRAIQGFSQIVLEENRAQLGPPYTDYLKKSISAASRLDRLLQDVLAITRLSRQQVTLEAVDVQQLIDQIIFERPDFQPPYAEITVNRPLLAMRAHEASLTQCITNLVNNAVKFVGPGVKPQVRIRSELLGEKVRLWIEDNGIGIEADAQSKLFQMFNRLHNEQQYEGTGVGLAIVRKAVDRMGGAVGVESQPGKGSRFWVELEAADGEVDRARK